MTRIDDELQDLSRSVANETAGPSPEAVALQVRRARRRRRTAVGGAVGGLSLVVAATVGVVDWSAVRPAVLAPAEAPAVVEPLPGDLIRCGTPESDIVQTTTLALSDVNPWQVEVTNTSGTSFFAASNGSARTVLVQDGRVVAMTLGEVQPLVPVDVGPGESQVLGVGGAQSCSGGEDGGSSAVPAGTYTAYRVLQVDELAGPTALDAWDGSNGSPVSIVSAPFALEVIDSVDASSFACGASVPRHLVVESGLQLVAEGTGSAEELQGLSIALLNGTSNPVTVGGNGWASVYLVRDGEVVAGTIGVPEPGFTAALAPFESVAVNYERFVWCPGIDVAEIDPSTVVAYGSLDIAPATGTTLGSVAGGPWRISAADLSAVAVEGFAVG